MDNSEKEKLLEETTKALSGSVHTPLKYMGIGRFDISNGRIVQKSIYSAFLSMFILTIIHGCFFYTIYHLSIKSSYLIMAENLIVLNFLTFHTCVLINMSFINRKSLAQFFNANIELDTFLGVSETMFMREITINTYFILCAFVGFTQVIILLVLFFTYIVDFAVCVSAGTMFVFMYVIYYDLSLFVAMYIVLTLRVRYLNVALMKIAKVKLEYIPEQFPFNAVFWKKKFDDNVTFHTRASAEMFCQGYEAIFDQLRYLECCYRFTLFCCLTYLAVGSFISVQSWIIWAKSTDIDIFRILAVSGWAALSWQFQLMIGQQTDMFLRQINQTKLICNFIQLKPTYTDEIYKLTANIIRTLEVRDPRVSIYGLFYFDTALLLRMASSIFVYITMQLQIAFSKNRDVVTHNGSSVFNNSSAVTVDS